MTLFPSRLSSSLLSVIPALLLIGCASTNPAPPVPHYDLHLRVFPHEARLAADLTITLPPTSDRETTLILGGGYEVTSVESGTAKHEVSPTDDPWKGLQEIVVSRSDGMSQTIRLRYAGPLQATGDPPLNAITPERVELNLDGMWVPLVRGFTTEFTLHAEIEGIPADLVVVAPGRIQRQGKNVIIDRGPDFDVTFVAQKDLQMERIDSLELYAVDPKSELVSLYRRHGKAAVQFLEDWFGPLPGGGGSTRIVVVRRPRQSGYARKDYIVLTENARPGGEAGTAKFIAHELAHAWWAPVDPDTEHRWLQESIAEYVALRYVEAALGRDHLEPILESKRKSAREATPILGRGPRTTAELYDKAPLLLFELESKIGREKLDRVLRELAKNPPSHTAQFLETLEEVAGEAAAREFESRMRE